MKFVLVFFLMVGFTINTKAQSIDTELKSFKKYFDSTLFGLIGPVQSCTTYVRNTNLGDKICESETVKFKIDGEVISDSVTYIRDDNNKIIEITYNSENFFGGQYTAHLSYKYNEGRIISETSWVEYKGENNKRGHTIKEYHYNTKGSVVKIVDRDLIGSHRIDLITEYTYMSYDSFGNWTERTYEDPVTLGVCTEIRKISYYSEEQIKKFIRIQQQLESYNDLFKTETSKTSPTFEMR